MQRTLLLERLVPGGVNRAREARVTAAGKPVNVARAICALGGRSLLLTLLGGDPGRFVAGELQRAGVPCEPVWSDDAPTRTCTTLVPDGGPVTELVEEGQPVSGRDAAALEGLALGHLRGARALCLAGSVPPGVPEDFYARLAAGARRAGVATLVDAKGALLRRALAERPFLVKPNLGEAAETLGLGDGLGAEGAVTALLEAGARWALVSEGEAGSLLGGDSGGRWRVEPPRVEAVNPIGSGDAMAAGLLVAIARGEPVPDAAVYGTACAAANVLTATSGELRPGDVAALLPEVRLSRLA